MKVNKNISAWMLIASIVLAGSVQQVRADDLDDATNKVLQLINKGKITKAANAAERQEWDDAFTAWKARLGGMGISAKPESLKKSILSIKDGTDVANAKKQILLLAASDGEKGSVRYRIKDLNQRIANNNHPYSNEKMKNKTTNNLLPVADAAARQV